MKKRTIKRSVKGYCPLTPVPAGIETVDPPFVITQCIDAGSNDVVAEGENVTEGQPLCKNAAHGAFTAMTGTVRRVQPWDGGPRGRFTAVTIEGTITGKRLKLCDPVSDTTATTFAELLKLCSVLGYQLPARDAKLLVMLLDEDVGAVTNRWLVEKDYHRIETGLLLLRHLYGVEALQIAAPASLSSERLRKLASFGRVMPVVERYPQVRAELVLHNFANAATGTTFVIDAARVVAAGEAVADGAAVTTMPVSLRYGKKGQTRLFQVPIGMRVGDFLASGGVTVGAGTTVLLGGDMCGVAADSLEQPLMPECTTVVVYDERETVVPENISCVNCGRCYRNCPAGLRVDLLGKAVEFTNDDELERLGIARCIDCGVCAAVCMVRRPLAHLMAYGKQRIKQYAGKAAS